MPSLQYTKDGYPFIAQDDGPVTLADVAPEAPGRFQDLAINRFRARPEPPLSDSTGLSALDKLLGFGGQERFQTWPEKMIRSAVTLPQNVVTGQIPFTPGLRREDITDIPRPNAADVGQSVFRPVAAQPQDALLERTQDLANLAMVGGMPFAKRGALGSAGGKLQSRPMSKEEIHKVGEASFNQHYVEPIQEVPIETLTGSTFRPERVEPLANKIKENGWIEPLVVDQAGNVIEGQHRLRALQKLGVKEVPVHKIVDLESVPGFAAAKSAAREAGAHPEQAQRIAGQISEIISKEGLPSVFEYEAPRGFEKPWNAALNKLRSGLGDEGALPATAPTGQLAQNAPRFYSAVEHAVENSKQQSATPDQWLGQIRNTPGVKPEELHWLGLEDWLKDQKGPVTKQKLQEHIDSHRIEVREVLKGRDGKPMLDAANRADAEILRENPNLNPESDEFFQLTLARMNQIRGAADHVEIGGLTKFSRWQLPGGENYRELLLTLPERGAVKYTKENVQPIAPHSSPVASQPGLFWYFRSPDNVFQIPKSKHPTQEGAWQYVIREKEPEAPSGLNYTVPGAHAYGDKASDVNRIAHIRFNDRMIDGKKTLFIEEVQSDWHQQGRKYGYSKNSKNSDTDQLYRDLGGNGPGSAALPDAPFKTTWPELSMKRMIRYAAEHGYEKIAWTPGEVQAARYDLSKQVSKVILNDPVWHGNNDIRGNLVVTSKANGSDIISKPVKSYKEIEELIGKEATEKLLHKPSSMQGRDHILDGDGLKVGGEGMLGFYDDILPSTVNKLVKKFGGKVKREKMDNTPVHTLHLPSELKNTAMKKGFPLFSGGAMLVPIDHNPFEKKQ